ncbi:hypothetical protein HanPSC8_Chr01g0039111 [Helianthus annuus]|nr:hypothetical protein HanPSC8_Chr01g0039111 [Helianthus annuus]
MNREVEICDLENSRTRISGYGVHQWWFGWVSRRWSEVLGCSLLGTDKHLVLTRPGPSVAIGSDPER